MIRSLIILSILLLTSQKPEVEVTFYGETSIKLTRYPVVEGPFLEVQIESADSTLQVSKYQYINMTLNLHSNETFLATKDCSGFTNSNFDSSAVNPKSAEKSAELHQIDFPKYTVKGFSASANIIVDPTHLVFRAPNKLTVATECDNKRGDFVKEYVGSLGLGYKGDSANNLLGENKAFALCKSIFWYLRLNPNVTEGLRGGPLFTLAPDDADWQLTGSVTAGINNKIEFSADPTTLIFDVTSEFVGLPTQLYNYFIESLEKAGVKPHSVLNVVQYKYKGLVSALPNLTITVNRNTIQITPQQYLPNYILNNADEKGMIDETSIPLNLELLEKGESSNHVTDSYYKKIILGQAFLQQYYTVFNTTDGKISFYNNPTITSPHPSPSQPSTKPSSSSSSSRPPANTTSLLDDIKIYLWIAVVVIVVLIVCLIVYLESTPKDTNYQPAPYDQGNHPQVAYYQNRQNNPQTA